MGEWERLPGPSPTKASAESTAKWWRKKGYFARLVKVRDPLPRWRRDKRGRLVKTKRKGFLWYIELKRKKSFLKARR